MTRQIRKVDVVTDDHGDYAVFVFDDGSRERLELPKDTERFNELHEFFRNDELVWSKEMG